MKATTVRCVCEKVEFKARGAPIVSVVCYCDDCQEGGRRIEALPNARVIRDADGGSPFLAYRKDRVRCVRGAELLQDHRIKDGSPTKRVVASCCNSGMYLDFEKGHWFSMYRAGFPGDAPPVQMHIQTKHRFLKSVAGDVPDYPGFPFPFLARLMGARVAMMLGR